MSTGAKTANGTALPSDMLTQKLPFSDLSTLNVKYYQSATRYVIWLKPSLAG